MISIAELKREFGLSLTDTQHDDSLGAIIGRVSQVMRGRTKRYLFCRVHSIVSDGSTATVTAFGHGLQRYDSVWIDGTGFEDGLDGEHQINVIDENRFTFPYNVSRTVTNGTVHPKQKVEFAGNDQITIWLPESFCPIADVTEVAVRVTLKDWQILEDSMFTFSTDDQYAKVVAIERVDGGVWESVKTYARSRVAVTRAPSVSVTGYIGFTRCLPLDLQEAFLSLCAEMWEGQGQSRGIDSESFDGVSRKRQSGVEREVGLLSPHRIIQDWACRLT